MKLYQFFFVLSITMLFVCLCGPIYMDSVVQNRSGMASAVLMLCAFIAHNKKAPVRRQTTRGYNQSR